MTKLVLTAPPAPVSINSMMVSHAKRQAGSNVRLANGSGYSATASHGCLLLAALLILTTCVSLPAAEPVVFDTQIRPILEARCYTCHGPRKQQAKLRLDSPEAILQGTPDGPVVVPGRAAESLLYKRISLPPDDLDIMPPDGGPLSAEQIAMIQSWIDQGAAFGAATSQPAEQTPPSQRTDLVDWPVVPPADPAAVRKLRDAGAWVVPLGGGNHLLSVSLRGHTGLGHRDAAALKLLTPLREQITWLDLGHTDVSDPALGALAALKNLTRLHLEKTAVGDAGLSPLQALGRLGYLNLYGTRITDAGLARLKPLTGLRQLFLWRTPVTDAGVADLCQALPELRVFRAVTTAPAETPSPPTIAPADTSARAVGAKPQTAPASTTAPAAPSTP